ncbi:hypothetical protein RND81_10G244600 [Saponaria officinalis]|uniref:KIB1-4 beta-propeller domain-containing protein n=1 Tax=Saponaria officinalis TaxID=3572 RepID=A0AAW1I819_SAPOF
MIRADWSRIPDDILRRIMEDYATKVEDYVIISCVCRSWYSITRTFDKSELRIKWSRQMPLLMLTDGNDTEIYRDTTKRARGTSYDFYASSYYDIKRFNVRDYVSGYDMEGRVRVHSDDDEDDDSNNGSDHSNMTRCILSLGRVSNKCFNVSLPEAYKKACWGSRYGWIVTLGRDRQLSLLNPLTRATLPLPSQRGFAFPWKGASGKTICHKFINKAVLLQVPRDRHRHVHISLDSPSCAYANGGIWVVVVIHQRYNLASIAKPGDLLWTPILRPNRNACYFGGFLDVTYCNRLNSLLFLDFNANVCISSLEDIEHPQVLRRIVNAPPSLVSGYRFSFGKMHYIVESGDDTLVITRYLRRRQNPKGSTATGNCDRTFKFRTYRLNFVTMRLNALRNLGGRALFLGNSATISVNSADAGCEANSIYFCDDDRYVLTKNEVGGHDMGVFKMADKTTRSFHDGYRSNSSYCCPLWFCPSI